MSATPPRQPRGPDKSPHYHFRSPSSPLPIYAAGSSVRHTSISLSNRPPHFLDNNNIAIINEVKENITILGPQHLGEAVDTTSGTSDKIHLNSASTSIVVSSSVNSAQPVLSTAVASALNSSSSKRSATTDNALEQKSSPLPQQPVDILNSEINSTDCKEIKENYVQPEHSAQSANTISSLSLTIMQPVSSQIHNGNEIQNENANQNAIDPNCFYSSIPLRRISSSPVAPSILPHPSSPVASILPHHISAQRFSCFAPSQ